MSNYTSFRRASGVGLLCNMMNEMFAQETFVEPSTVQSKIIQIKREWKDIARELLYETNSYETNSEKITQLAAELSKAIDSDRALRKKPNSGISSSAQR